MEIQKFESAQKAQNNIGKRAIDILIVYKANYLQITTIYTTIDYYFYLL